MRVLGIDCGTEYTGYGVVELGDDGALICLTCGAIRLSTRNTMASRLATIFEGLGKIITEHNPDNVAIEDVFSRAGFGPGFVAKNQPNPCHSEEPFFGAC